MRIVYVFMSMFLFSLVAIPLVSSVVANSEIASCCTVHNEQGQSNVINNSHNNNNNNNNNTNDCCDGSCNPLINCCGMMGFVISNPLQLSIVSHPSQQENIDLFQGQISQITSEYWQPPRV